MLEEAIEEFGVNPSSDDDTETIVSASFPETWDDCNRCSIFSRDPLRSVFCAVSETEIFSPNRSLRENCRAFQSVMRLPRKSDPQNCLPCGVQYLSYLITPLILWVFIDASFLWTSHDCGFMILLSISTKVSKWLFLKELPVKHCLSDSNSFERWQYNWETLMRLYIMRELIPWTINAKSRCMKSSH